MRRRSGDRPRPVQRAAKRLADVLVSAVSLLLLAPIAVAVAAAIPATMGRLVFFRQPRLGHRGREFVILKFRTMTEARGADGALLQDGGRLTRLVRFLRAIREALPSILAGNPPRSRQAAGEGTLHRRADLLVPAVQEIKPDEEVHAGPLIDRLMALTTDRLDEAAYLVRNGTRYRVQVRIVPQPVAPEEAHEGGER